MAFLPGILALLTGIAGWFYMFYSRAAHRLSGLERQRLNDHRIRLRRLGGGVMFLLAITLYVGFYAVRPESGPRLFVAIWLGVFVLLGLIVLLALVDVYLTFRLRRALAARLRSGEVRAAIRRVDP